MSLTERSSAATDQPESAVESSARSGLLSRSLGWTLSVGPGLVYILSILGSGDIVANATAGASYGYSLIWALGLTLIFRFVWVNTSAKYVLVSGETLLAGYRRIRLGSWRIGEWVVWMILIALIPQRHVVNAYLIVMCGSSAHLLMPLPTEWSASIWALFFTLIGFAMMFWGGYPTIEAFCKVLITVMGASMVMAALLSRLDPAAMLQGMLIPSVPQSEGLYSAVLIIIALIGTEAGSMANLHYPYFILEKGWNNVSYLQRQRFDLALGVVCMFLMGAMLQVAAAASIHPLGIQMEGADDLVRIFSETQGLLGLVVFGLGLWGASFSSLVSSNTAGALIMTDLCRSLIPALRIPREVREKQNAKHDPIYRWAIAFWSFSPLYIIFIGVRPVWLVLIVSSMVAFLIPLLAVPLLVITNNRELVGEYRNSWLTNTVIVMLVVVAVYFGFWNIGEMWGLW